jgi:hypothetical protein
VLRDDDCGDGSAVRAVLHRVREEVVEYAPDAERIDGRDKRREGRLHAERMPLGGLLAARHGLPREHHEVGRLAPYLQRLPGPEPGSVQELRNLRLHLSRPPLDLLNPAADLLVRRRLPGELALEQLCLAKCERQSVSQLLDDLPVMSAEATPRGQHRHG